MYETRDLVLVLMSRVVQTGDMPQSKTTALIAQSLHVSRFGTYATAAGGDMDLALRLYLWNIELAGAFHSSLGLLEVILRNTIDAELRAWNASQSQPDGTPYPPEWLIDPAKPLNTLTASARKTATQNAVKARAARPASHPRKHAPITHDDILAQLTFGVFVRLLPTSDSADKTFRARQVLWQEALIRAFPGSCTDSDGHIVAGRAGRLLSLRNRVAHTHSEPSARHRPKRSRCGAERGSCAGNGSGTVERRSTPVNEATSACEPRNHAANAPIDTPARPRCLGSNPTVTATTKAPTPRK